MPVSRESTLPPSWQTSSAQSLWWTRVAAAEHSVLILDYDGTLAPFRLDRLEALPYPGVQEHLSQILSLDNVTVILVTGRSCREIKNVYEQARQMEVWASHGREHAYASGEYEFIQLSPEQKTVLHDVMVDLAAAALPPSAIERKPASIAIHWRGLERDEQELLRKRVLKRFERHTINGVVELLPFEDGVELRATGRTKGDAVREIQARFAADVPVAYLGDDHTDEEAFAAMRADDLALLVRPAPRGTLANYWMTAPDDVLNFLDQWSVAAGKHRHSPANTVAANTVAGHSIAGDSVESTTTPEMAMQGETATGPRLTADTSPSTGSPEDTLTERRGQFS